MWKSGCGFLMQHLSGRAEENHKKSQIKIAGPWPGNKLKGSQMQATYVIILPTYLL
jgi:hypothetical protein